MSDFPTPNRNYGDEVIIVVQARAKANSSTELMVRISGAYPQFVSRNAMAGYAFG
jgi:hypothetical protein